MISSCSIPFDVPKSDQLEHLRQRISALGEISIKRCFEGDKNCSINNLVIEFECLATILDSFGRSILRVHQRLAEASDNSSVYFERVRSATAYLNGCAVSVGFLLVQFQLSELPTIKVSNALCNSLCTVLQSSAALTEIEVIGINAEWAKGIRCSSSGSKCGACAFTSELSNHSSFISALDQVHFLRGCIYCYCYLCFKNKGLAEYRWAIIFMRNSA